MDRMCNIYRLGKIEYSEAYRIQRSYVEKRMNKQIDDSLLLLEHYPVITLGKSGKLENLIASKDILKQNNISLFFVDRGGDATYHGPGQLVGYPIIDLDCMNMNFHNYIYNLEQTIINTLKEFKVDSFRKENYRGVWTQNGKIASIGVRVIKSVTMHGFALNINPSLEHFNFIIPCGLANVRMSSLLEVSKKEVPMKTVMEIYEYNFSKIFKYRIEHASFMV